MSFELIYEEKVKKEDIPKLSPSLKVRIRTAIEEKLTTEPEKFGKPLRKSLKGNRKLRVGNYRVLFRIEGARVIIFAIRHRSEAYKYAVKRV